MEWQNGVAKWSGKWEWQVGVASGSGKIEYVLLPSGGEGGRSPDEGADAPIFSRQFSVGR